MIMAALTGCQTIHGAANGMAQDVQNISNPDQNGWNTAQKMDAWMRQNMW
jgi:hypothetical protein